MSPCLYATKPLSQHDDMAQCHSDAMAPKRWVAMNGMNGRIGETKYTFFHWLVRPLVGLLDRRMLA